MSQILKSLLLAAALLFVVGSDANDGASRTSVRSGVDKAASAQPNKSGDCGSDVASGVNGNLADRETALISGCVNAVPQAPTGCADQSVSWGAGNICAGAAVAAANGATIVVTNVTSQYLGTADFFCDNGDYRVTGTPTCEYIPKDCNVQSVGWGTDCAASAPATTHTNTVSVTNSAADRSGTAVFKCEDGHQIFESGSCAITNRPCSERTVNWKSCSGSLPALAHQSEQTVTNVNAGYDGSATYLCNNASLTKTSQSCVAQGCPSIAQSWGDGCSGVISATSSGSTRDVSSTAGGRAGTATYSCFLGNWSYESGSCSRTDNPCPGGEASWGDACTASYGTITHGGAATLSNTNGARDGSVKLSCANGTVTQSNASCAPATCSATTVNWGSCSAPAGTTTHGTTLLLTSSSSGYTGSASFVCDAGSYQLASGSSCIPRPCPTESLTWGAGCSSNVTGVSSGSSSSATSTAEGFTGSANFSCSLGNWSYTSGSCSAAGCAAKSVTWGDACQGSLSGKASGNSLTISNTKSSRDGSATFACDHGDWNFKSGSCAPKSCTGATLTWGAGCSASAPNTSSGSTRSLTNSESNYTGNATFACSEGSWALQSQSCSRVERKCDHQTVRWGASNACSADYPESQSGDSAAFDNVSPGYQGTTSARCDDGTVVLSSSTCGAELDLQPCRLPAKSVSGACWEYTRGETVPAGEYLDWYVYSGAKNGYVTYYCPEDNTNTSAYAVVIDHYCEDVGIPVE